MKRIMATVNGLWAFISVMKPLQFCGVTRLFLQRHRQSAIQSAHLGEGLASGAGQDSSDTDIKCVPPSDCPRLGPPVWSFPVAVEHVPGVAAPRLAAARLSRPPTFKSGIQRQGQDHPYGSG